jgi:hypothetical protein
MIFEAITLGAAYAGFYRGRNTRLGDFEARINDAIGLFAFAALLVASSVIIETGEFYSETPKYPEGTVPLATIQLFTWCSLAFGGNLIIGNLTKGKL